jgi:hypothetical protein
MYGAKSFELETEPMPFPIPEKYSSEAADVARDEAKRRVSPPSFFFAQTQALFLSAEYFKNDRLQPSARGGVANKHRNRIRSALFGQVMASFEFCIKDFIAQVIDSSDVFDEAIHRCKWIDVDKSRVLAQRDVAGSVGALLIHPLLGWHDTDELNKRFEELFKYQLLDRDEAQKLRRLWIIRHSVAHNGGFVTHHDAYRLQAPTSEKGRLRWISISCVIPETSSGRSCLSSNTGSRSPITLSANGSVRRRRVHGVRTSRRIPVSGQS